MAAPFRIGHGNRLYGTGSGQGLFAGTGKDTSLVSKGPAPVGIAEGQAESASRFLMTAYEGYLLQYRLSKDIQWLRSMRDDLAGMKLSASRP